MVTEAAHDESFSNEGPNLLLYSNTHPNCESDLILIHY